MSITANSIVNDSINFFKNQLDGLFVLSFISAIISLIIYYFLVPINEIVMIIKIMDSKDNLTSLLTWVSKLSNEEKKMIIRISLLSLTAVFIGLIILVSSVVTYLSELSSGNNINALQAFVLSLYTLPYMLILLVIYIIITYFGFILFILPGIILTIGFSLSPVILIKDKNTMLLRAISRSWKIAFHYWWLILSILLLWLILQVLVTALLGQFYFLPNIVNNIVSFTLNNLITSFTLIYFFRLYMLVNKKYVD